MREKGEGCRLNEKDNGASKTKRRKEKGPLILSTQNNVDNVSGCSMVVYLSGDDNVDNVSGCTSSISF